MLWADVMQNRWACNGHTKAHYKAHNIHNKTSKYVLGNLKMCVGITRHILEGQIWNRNGEKIFLKNR
jgi:hypothetical protein